AGRARLDADVVGEGLDLDPPVLGAGGEVGAGLLRLLGHLLLHFTPADLPLLERGDADADRDVRGVLEGLARVEVHRVTLLRWPSGGLGGVRRCRGCRGLRGMPEALPSASTLATITQKINS